MLAQGLVDRVAGEAASQEMLDDLPPLRGGGDGRHALSGEHARDALGLVLGRQVPHELTRDVAVDATRGELAHDAEPAASLHAPGRADVRGGDAAIVERAVGGQAVDQVVGFALFAAAREEPLAELGGRVVTPAEQPESNRAR